MAGGKSEEYECEAGWCPEDCPNMSPRCEIVEDHIEETVHEVFYEKCDKCGWELW